MNREPGLKLRAPNGEAMRVENLALPSDSTYYDSPIERVNQRPNFEMNYLVAPIQDEVRPFSYIRSRLSYTWFDGKRHE